MRDIGKFQSDVVDFNWGKDRKNYYFLKYQKVETNKIAVHEEKKLDWLVLDGFELLKIFT